MTLYVPAERTPDEVNFLRLLHLLFRVAGPVVRMIFNREIQPNQLRKLLDKNKAKLEKQCRKKEKIDSYQWDLLYKNVKGKTKRNNYSLIESIQLISIMLNARASKKFLLYTTMN